MTDKINLKSKIILKQYFLWSWAKSNIKSNYPVLSHFPSQIVLLFVSVFSFMILMSKCLLFVLSVNIVEVLETSQDSFDCCITATGIHVKILSSLAVLSFLLFSCLFCVSLLFMLIILG